MHDNASELYNGYLEIYFDEYKALPNGKKELSNKYNPVYLFLETCNLRCETCIMPCLKMKNHLIKNDENLKICTVASTLD